MATKSEILRVSDTQKKALALATIAAVIVGVIFLSGYLMLIAFAAIAAYLFRPVYEWLMRHGVKSGGAGTLTFIATLLAVVIPAAFVIIITTAQLAGFVDDIRTDSLDVDIGALGTNIIQSINDFLANMGIDYKLTEQGVIDKLSEIAETVGTNILDAIVGSLTGFFGLFTAFIIYIFVFLSILRNQDKIADLIGSVNPLGPKITNVYLGRMGSMTKAMVRGQFIIAICQGLTSAIGLWIVGLGDLFFFFFLVLSVLSIIPLGAGIVTIPMGMIMILFGNVWQGIFVILNHVLIVTNIDNVMKPRLVPSDARLDPALTILSVFAGMAFFGFIGIVLGPVLMIVLVTTVQLFLEVFRNVDAFDNTKTKKKSIFGFVDSIKKTIIN